MGVCATSRWLPALVAVLTIGSGAPWAAGQSTSQSKTADDGQSHAEHQVIDSMSHHHMEGSPHIRLTAKRAEQPGDQERAAAIVAALRPALERYRDYHVALQNGFEVFMPNLPQPVYHFSNYLEGYAETFRFRPDQATSLLYRKIPGGYQLVGAMYTAPSEATEDELDARVPLSIARWHAHVNICLPPRGAASTADWTKFGPDGSLSTPQACAAAHGRFVPQLFGWMVHVYPFETAPDKIWGMD